MLRNSFGVVSVFVLGLGLASDPASGADWTKWRGPHGNGITDETDWDPNALAGRPKVVWESQVGLGYSSVAVRGDHLYTIGHKLTRADDDTSGVDTVYCLDSLTGKEVWRFSYPCTTDDGYPGPTATPVIDGDWLYTISDDSGDLFCLNAATGSVRWRVNVISKFAAESPHPGFGYSGSAVIEGGLLLLNINTGGMALDVNTGEKIWGSKPGPCSYSSPVVFDHQGKRLEALFGAKKLFILDVASGAVRASHPWDTFANENSADPLVIGDRIFISSSYDMGCALLKLSDGGLELLWQNKELGNLFTSSVYLDGFVYGIDGLRRRNNLKCLQLETGKVMWSERMDFAALIAADNKLIIITERGLLKIVEATSAEYREIASAKVMGTSAKRGSHWWTNPVLANSHLWVRSDKGDLVCVDMSGKGGK